MRLAYGLASLIAVACLVAAFAFPAEGNALDNPPGAIVSAAVAAIAPESLSASPQHPAVIGIECSRAIVRDYIIQVSDATGADRIFALSDFRAGGRDGSGGIVGA